MTLQNFIMMHTERLKHTSQYHIKRVVTGISLFCMIMMTLWPLFHGINADSINAAISWFWVAWAVISIRFLLVSARRWNTTHTWARLRTSNLALALILLGLDTARIRTDFLDYIVNPHASSLGVYLVRLYCGWSFVIFMAMFRPMDEGADVSQADIAAGG